MVKSATVTVSLIYLLAGIALSNGQYHHGYGTAYSAPFRMDSTGQNMCELNPQNLDPQWQVYYAAMNWQDWNAAGGGSNICGRCIKVVGTKGQTTPGFQIQPVIVKVVDQCPSCDRGDVDFSTTALAAITGYPWDKKKIIWEYVTCPKNPQFGVTTKPKGRKSRGKKRSRKHLKS
jgi:expansin (peptidoglycan-binding protein)